MREWKRAAEDIFASGARPLKLFLLGATDTGKTTLAAFLTNVAVSAGLKAAVVDADVGQSEIGPPGSVGCGFAQGPIERLRDIPLAHGYFVGSNSPELLSFTTAAAAKSAVDRALSSEPDVVIIDTTGLVWGRTARFLKNAKIELIEPTHVLALQRDIELEHLLRPWEVLGSPTVQVRRLPVSPRATEKSRRDRRAAREKAYRQYFAGAALHEFDLSRTALFRSTYLTGRPMDESETALLATDLRCRIAHAEWLADGIFIVADGYFELDGLQRIKERERVEEVFLTKVDKFENLLTGLIDRSGQLLGVGILRAVDFRRRTATVLSPLDDSTLSRVAGLQPGILKVFPNGEEGGKIHPNDI
ncbi:MAG: Clp1/GlmU family protein [Bacillota bacterium]